MLIHAFVSSRVDYCKSLLSGLPAYQLNKLQRVQNAATRLIFQESKYCHVRPLPLPYAIRGSPSVASFKQALKPFLFQKVFL